MEALAARTYRTDPMLVSKSNARSGGYSKDSFPLQPHWKGKERKGKERKGKERKGKERKGKERKGENAVTQAGLTYIVLFFAILF